ncbi:MAG: DUF4956 domain-containing protein [Acidobacteriota bacterium]
MDSLSSLGSRNVTILEFLPNLLLAALLSYVLSLIYQRFARSLSNKRTFAATFLPITLTTAMIIAILQTNIVLSLGLVGALSIIRFRTAIKEPEELSYIFFCIAIGLGAGAGQRGLTLLGFALVTSILCGRGLWQRRDEAQNLLLTITGPRQMEIEQLIEILQASCSWVDLKRLEDIDDTLEAAFVIELDSVESLTRVRQRLQQLDDTLATTFVDHRPLA